MKYRSKPTEIEANQFFRHSEAPIGVRGREDGSCYVITKQGEEVAVHDGDFIILENPPGDGTRAYPCAPDVFRKRWEPIKEG
jgi:hypothetical protein